MEINNLKRLADDIFAYPLDNNLKIVAENVWLKQRQGRVESIDAMITSAHKLTNDIWASSPYSIIIDEVVTNCVDFMNKLRSNKLELSKYDRMLLDLVYNVGLSTKTIASSIIGDGENASKTEKNALEKYLAKGNNIGSLIVFINDDVRAHILRTRDVKGFTYYIDERLENILDDFRSQILSDNVNLALQYYKINNSNDMGYSF